MRFFFISDDYIPTNQQRNFTFNVVRSTNTATTTNPTSRTQLTHNISRGEAENTSVQTVFPSDVSLLSSTISSSPEKLIESTIYVLSTTSLDEINSIMSTSTSSISEHTLQETTPEDEKSYLDILGGITSISPSTASSSSPLIAISSIQAIAEIEDGPPGDKISLISLSATTSKYSAEYISPSYSDSVASLQTSTPPMLSTSKADDRVSTDEAGDTVRETSYVVSHMISSAIVDVISQMSHQRSSYGQVAKDTSLTSSIMSSEATRISPATSVSAALSSRNINDIATSTLYHTFEKDDGNISSTESSHNLLTNVQQYTTIHSSSLESGSHSTVLTDSPVSEQTMIIAPTSSVRVTFYFHGLFNLVCIVHNPESYHKKNIVSP